MIFFSFSIKFKEPKKHSSNISYEKKYTRIEFNWSALTFVLDFPRFRYVKSDSWLFFLRSFYRLIIRVFLCAGFVHAIWRVSASLYIFHKFKYFYKVFGHIDCKRTWLFCLQWKFKWETKFELLANCHNKC